MISRDRTTAAGDVFVVSSTALNYIQFGRKTNRGTRRTRYSSRGSPGNRGFGPLASNR